MVLAGDELMMTETGSVGSIDGQVPIGRSLVPAYDYKEWIDTKRAEAHKTRRLNPVDATMVAQISPGELIGAENALNYARDPVK